MGPIDLTVRYGRSLTIRSPARLSASARLTGCKNSSRRAVARGRLSRCRSRTGESLEPTFKHEGVNHFCLRVDDLDVTLAELEARGVPLLGEPFVVEEIGRRLAFIKDNSGNRIEFSGPRLTG